MTTTGRAYPVYRKPLPDMHQMPAVGTSLAPNIQTPNDLMANAAPSVTRRMAPVAQPTHSLQGFLAFTTICVKPGALLIQLKH